MSDSIKQKYPEGKRPANFTQLVWAERDSGLIKILSESEYKLFDFLLKSSRRDKDGEFRCKLSRAFIESEIGISVRRQQELTNELTTAKKELTTAKKELTTAKKGLLHVRSGGIDAPNIYTINSARVYRLAQERLEKRKEEKAKQEQVIREELAQVFGADFIFEPELQVTAADENVDDLVAEKPETDKPSETPAGNKPAPTPEEPEPAAAAEEKTEDDTFWWDESINPETIVSTEDWKWFADKGLHMHWVAYMYANFGITKAKYEAIVSAAKRMHERCLDRNWVVANLQNQRDGKSLIEAVFDLLLTSKDDFWLRACRKSGKAYKQCPVTFFLANYDQKIKPWAEGCWFAEDKRTKPAPESDPEEDQDEEQECKQVFSLPGGKYCNQDGERCDKNGNLIDEEELFDEEAA